MPEVVTEPAARVQGVRALRSGAIGQASLNHDPDTAVQETMTFSSARRVGGRGGIAMLSKDRALMIAWGVGSAFVAAGLVVGCGGDGDGGGGDVSTGIAPSKLLSDVTANEAAQACERFEQGFDSVFSRDVFVRAICTLFGAASEDTAAACTTARDMCLQEANMAGSDVMMNLEMIEFDFDCGEGEEINQCSGTVGQLETCFNDTLDVFRAMLAQWTCDDAPTLTMDDLESFGEETEPPASCESIDCGGDGPLGSGPFEMR
jgi:hypothetical protein